jgi:RNase adaptor protein for sRNA GlmZ degradation
MPSQPSPSLPRPAGVTITSFGYLHGAPPEGAHLTADVRHHFRDPHVSPLLRELDAADRRVRDSVLATPGVRDFIMAIVRAVQALRAGSAPGPVTVAIGCAGGRHRAPVIAITLARLLNAAGVTATVQHRDITRPVITRAAQAAGSVA